jgi:PIN domain nuclease of toxin-antitoxin system
LTTLVDLWYWTQTTRAITVDDLARVRAALNASARVDLHMIDTSIADAYTAIPRSVLSDPWDRFIVATARVHEAPVGNS